MINLNTQGNYENIQCIYGGYLPSSNIIHHSIAVTFAGSYITQACAVVYCPIDNNIFIEINRETFQNHPAVQAMANLGSQVLSVAGTFTVQLSTGATQEFVVDRWGYAQIIRPGQKK